VLGRRDNLAMPEIKVIEPFLNRRTIEYIKRKHNQKTI
jgi:hypothetical protein